MGFFCFFKFTLFAVILLTCELHGFPLCVLLCLSLCRIVCLFEKIQGGQTAFQQKRSMKLAGTVHNQGGH